MKHGRCAVVAVSIVLLGLFLLSAAAFAQTERNPPTKFQWEYKGTEEPGPRYWTREGSQWVERYTSGYFKRFQIVRSDTAHYDDGTFRATLHGTVVVLVEQNGQPIANPSFTLFIPDLDAEKPWLLCQREEKWGFLARILKMEGAPMAQSSPPSPPAKVPPTVSPTGTTPPGRSNVAPPPGTSEAVLPPGRPAGGAPPVRPPATPTPSTASSTPSPRPPVATPPTVTATRVLPNAHPPAVGVRAPVSFTFGGATYKEPTFFLLDGTRARVKALTGEESVLPFDALPQEAKAVLQESNRLLKVKTGQLMEGTVTQLLGSEGRDQRAYIEDALEVKPANFLAGAPVSKDEAKSFMLIWPPENVAYRVGTRIHVVVLGWNREKYRTNDGKVLTIQSKRFMGIGSVSYREVLNKP